MAASESSSVKLFKEDVKWKEKRRKYTMKVDKKVELELIIKNACSLHKHAFF